MEMQSPRDCEFETEEYTFLLEFFWKKPRLNLA